MVLQLKGLRHILKITTKQIAQAVLSAQAEFSIVSRKREMVELEDGKKPKKLARLHSEPVTPAKA